MCMSVLFNFLCTCSSCHQDKFFVYANTLDNEALSDSDYCSKVFLCDVRVRFFLFSVRIFILIFRFVAKETLILLSQLKIVLNEVWKPLGLYDSLMNWKFRKTVYLFENLL